MLRLLNSSRTAFRNFSPASVRASFVVNRMSSSSTFVEKVQNLQPELLGATEEDKKKIQGLVGEVPTLAKDLQVCTTIQSHHRIRQSSSNMTILRH